MTFHHFIAGREISAEGYPFYGIIQAAMRQADSTNQLLLQMAFPEVWDELQARYNAPGGALPGDMIPSSVQVRDEVWATLDRPAPRAFVPDVTRVEHVTGRTGIIRNPWPRQQPDGSTVPGVNEPGHVTVQWDGNPRNHTARIPVEKLTVEAPVSPTHETEEQR